MDARAMFRRASATCRWSLSFRFASSIQPLVLLRMIRLLGVISALNFVGVDVLWDIFRMVQRLISKFSLLSLWILRVITSRTQADGKSWSEFHCFVKRCCWSFENFSGYILNHSDRQDLIPVHWNIKMCCLILYVLSRTDLRWEERVGLI